MKGRQAEAITASAEIFLLSNTLILPVRTLVAEINILMLLQDLIFSKSTIFSNISLSGLKFKGLN